MVSQSKGIRYSVQVSVYRSEVILCAAGRYYSSYNRAFVYPHIRRDPIVGQGMLLDDELHRWLVVAGPVFGLWATDSHQDSTVSSSAHRGSALPR